LDDIIPPDRPGYGDGSPTAQLEILPGESPGEYTLRGEIDLHTAPQIAEISTRKNGTIILDFAAVTFIDSIGVWAIVNLVRGPDGGTLVIKNPSGNVKRTFDLVGIRDARGIVVE
jgi:anti-anti-sigma factor